MAITTNPFVVLSYVGGPAILTNAASLLLMSTSNRFARAVDRSRELMKRMSTPKPGIEKTADYEEMFIVRRRVRQIATALSCLYLAAAMFGLATLLSVAGAVLAEIVGGPISNGVIVAAMCAGIVGFVGFVLAGIILVIESRLALKSLLSESDEALARLDTAVKSLGAQ
ncbi:MAG TPA: DUF2721 domain-containing protein [Alphaproteobacteria bacterium]|nr:DUF2721 domain-containing protein [Alphaproteobacteria bacterium]